MNIKQRAHYLLTCDELHGRVPKEVRAFLRDVVALEPVAYALYVDGMTLPVSAEFRNRNPVTCSAYQVPLYPLGADHDPA